MWDVSAAGGFGADIVLAEILEMWMMTSPNFKEGVF